MNTGEMTVVCHQGLVLAGSAALATMGTLILYTGTPSRYGKHSQNLSSRVPLLPARVAWFLQELPSFVVSVGMLAWQPRSLFGQPGNLLLGLFSLHYFHRLAFSLQSALPCWAPAQERTNVDGQRAQWGGARSEAGLECWASPGFRLDSPELGRTSAAPNLPAAAALERRWQRREWVGEAGELRLGRS